MKYINFLILFSLSISSGYYFEKNKVQYKNFNFSVYKSKHFDIYVENEAYPLASFSEQVLEKTYMRYRKDFGFDIGAKIPVIIYNSEENFTQTNVMLEPLEESVGGFSEILKNRMVIPFTGSYADFEHVLEHELTHIFQFKLFFSLNLEQLFSLVPGFSIPLWVMEGQAEFCSNHGSRDSYVYLRDLVLNDKLIPLTELNKYYGYIIYREGESVFLFIEKEYGRKKVFEFIENLKFKKSLNEASLKTFGITLNQLDREWRLYLKKTVCPDVNDVFSSKNYMRELIKKKNIYIKGISIDPTGKKVAYIEENRNGHKHIVILSLLTGRKILSFSISEAPFSYEKLPLLKGYPVWNEDGSYIGYFVYKEGKPEFILRKYSNGKINKKIKLKLDGAWGGNIRNNTLVFTGLKDGEADLYTLNIKTKALKRLTYDTYIEKDPQWKNDTIYFISDRASSSSWHLHKYAIFKMHNDNIERVSPYLSRMERLSISNDTIYFSGPGYEIYSYYKHFEKKSKWGKAIFEVSAANSHVGFVYLDNSKFNIAIAKRLKSLPLDSIKTDTNKATYKLKELVFSDFKRYKPLFSPDYIYGAASYSTAGGFNGNLYVGVSDILGNHRIYFSSDMGGDILNSAFSITYWYLPYRVDFGAGLFQLPLYYLTEDSTGYTLIHDVYRGGELSTAYPFSIYTRVENNLIAAYIDETRYEGFDPYTSTYTHLVDGLFYTLFIDEIALVYDNARWNIFYPSDGMRMRLGVYKSFLSSFDFLNGYGDVRLYREFYTDYTLALRGYITHSIGRDAEIFSPAGSKGIRGVNSDSMIGNGGWLSTVEIRYPFIRSINFDMGVKFSILNIRGVGFVDMGQVWDKDFNTVSNVNGGYGFGLRWFIGYFILKYDIAFPLWFNSINDNSYKMYLSLGVDF